MPLKLCIMCIELSVHSHETVILLGPPLGSSLVYLGTLSQLKGLVGKQINLFQCFVE